MRKKLAISIFAGVCVLGFTVGSFWCGLKVGAQNGTWRADTETAAVLVHALKFRDAGDEEKSLDSLHTLLYSAIASTDRYRDNIFLTADNRKAGEKWMQAVADYYWRHPTSFDLQWQKTNGLPAGTLCQAMAPVVELYRERNKRISQILITRKRVEPSAGPNALPRVGQP